MKRQEARKRAAELVGRMTLEECETYRQRCFGAERRTLRKKHPAALEIRCRRVYCVCNYLKEINE